MPIESLNKEMAGIVRMPIIYYAIIILLSILLYLTSLFACHCVILLKRRSLAMLIVCTSVISYYNNLPRKYDSHQFSKGHLSHVIGLSSSPCKWQSQHLHLDLSLQILSLVHCMTISSLHSIRSSSIPSLCQRLGRNIIPHCLRVLFLGLLCRLIRETRLCQAGWDRQRSGIGRAEH